MTIRLHVHPDVQAALDARVPVVALESTVITHGLPYPDNVDVAHAIETAVKDAGAVPATIAILAGNVTVGLTTAQLERLASDTHVRKCSRRDIALAIARHEHGATTVAATMIVARWAGIRVFATGGIGGVHRNHPFDESADLLELGRTPVAVVCAGAKAILDIPLTLEVLETYGVPVLGYQTDDFPAFYSRHSGLKVDLRVETAQEIADIIIAQDETGLRNGILVTVPVPVEAEWPAAEAQAVISQALRDAEQHAIMGKDVTPYLLQRVSELSGARSKTANIALLLNNARVGAEIATCLASISGDGVIC